jgi:quercetin dioxygenase-like cupin family protein
VDFRVLLRQPGLALAQLRLAPQATIEEHSAPFSIEVICLEGAGMVKIGELTHPLIGGQRVHWPAGVNHLLWTEGESMLTLMVENLPT